MYDIHDIKDDPHHIVPAYPVVSMGSQALKISCTGTSNYLQCGMFQRVLMEL